MERVRTSCLEIAYEQSGTPDAFPVVLLHGFPYDPRAFDQVVPLLTAAGLRTTVPYLRGYGGTRFLSTDTMRWGSRPRLRTISWSFSMR
jgi:pimeloyl-ACP methyl ester carboxylesterase